MRCRTAMAVAAALGAAVLGAAAGGGQAQDPAKPAAGKPIKIGFVSVKQIVDDYKRVKHENELIRKRAVRYNATVEEMTAQEGKLNDQRELTDPGSLKHNDLTREILKLQQDIKFEKEWTRYRINADGAKVLVDVYRELLAAVAEHAQREGYTLVLKIDEAKMDADQRLDVELRIQTRTVLFHDPEHDITKPVIEALNARWDKVKPPDSEPKDKPAGDQGSEKPGAEKPPGGAEKPGSGSGDKKAGG